MLGFIGDLIQDLYEMALQSSLPTLRSNPPSSTTVFESRRRSAFRRRQPRSAQRRPRPQHQTWRRALCWNQGCYNRGRAGTALQLGGESSFSCLGNHSGYVDGRDENFAVPRFVSIVLRSYVVGTRSIPHGPLPTSHRVCVRLRPERCFRWRVCSYKNRGL